MEGITYFYGGEAAIPAADLTAIGDPDAFENLAAVWVSSDRTLYAIAGTNQGQVLALAINSERWLAEFRASELGREPPFVPTHAIFLAEGVTGFPEALCRYYADPRQESTPPVCRVAIRVTFNDTAYRPWPDPGSSGKVSKWGYYFPASALTPVGSLTDVDPRIGFDVDPQAYAIAGFDPAVVIVLIDGAGSEDEAHEVFLAESVDAAPPELCQYSRDSEITGCP